MTSPRVPVHNHSGFLQGGKLELSRVLDAGEVVSVGGGSTTATVESLVTTETDTTTRLAPDGSGGVDWVAEGASSSRLYDTNVVDYGAVGDDTTDDTAAIQAALDATPDGGTCFFPTPPSKYRITAALTRADADGAIRLLGAGTMYGLTTIRQATANTDAFSSAVDVLSSFNSSGIDNSRNYERSITIENLRIEGPTGATNAASGVGIYALADLHLRNVTTYGFHDGVYVGAHGSFSSVDRLRSTGATNAGLYMPTGNNLTVFNSQFWFCKYGIYAADFLNVRVRDSVFEQNTTAGLEAEGKTGSTTTSRSLLVDGCFFEETAVNIPDIVLGRSFNLTAAKVTDCYFQDNAQGDTLASWHIDSYHVTQLTLDTNRLSGGGSTGGDIRCSADTTAVVLLNQQYVTASGLPVATITLDPLTAFALRGVISPAQLTANTDNWAPTGLSTAGVIRVSTDASRNLTGITGGASGRLLLLSNIGAQDLVLKHNVTSTAANRFFCPNDADFTLAKDCGIFLEYDATSSRWRVVTSPAGSGAVTFAVPSGGYGTAAAGAGTDSMRASAVLPKPTAADVDFSADVTTNNVSATAHGLAPKFPNDATKYLDGTGAYTTPTASPSGFTFIGCRAYHSTTQTVASAAAGAVALDTEDYDTSAFHFVSNAALTGTVAKNGTTAIVGTGTSFTTELSVNQVISIPGTTTEIGVVAAIADNTHLTLVNAMVNTASGQTATRRSAFMAIPAGLGGNYNISGNFRWTTVTTAKMDRGNIAINTDLTGSVGVGIANQSLLTVTSSDNWINLSTTYKLVAGDTVALLFVNNESGTVTLSNAAHAAPVLTIAQVGV